MTNFKIRITQRWLFYTLFSLLMLLLFFRYALQVNLPPILFVAVSAVIAFLGDRDEIFAMCICCIPLYAAMQYYYVVMFCIVVYLYKYIGDIKLDFAFIPMILMVVWEILHCFSVETNLRSMIAMIVPYVLFVVLFSIRDIKIDYGFIVRTLSVMVLWMCIILVVRLMITSEYNLDVAFFNMQRLGMSGEEDATGFEINPNSLGVQCVLAVTCLLQLRMSGRKNASDLVLMMALLVLGALTASRTYLACLLIMAVLVLIASKGGAKKKIQLLLGIIGIILIAILLLYLIFPTALELFIMRLQAADITGGRADLFSQFNDYLTSSAKALFWGIGSLDMKNKIVYTYSIAGNVPHNGIQELLVAWGIPGLMMFIAFLCVLIRRSKRENSQQMLVNYIPLIIWFAKIQVGQMITSAYTMLAFALLYFSLCVSFHNETTNDSLEPV